MINFFNFSTYVSRRLPFIALSAPQLPLQHTENWQSLRFPPIRKVDLREWPLNPETGKPLLFNDIPNDVSEWCRTAVARGDWLIERSVWVQRSFTQADHLPNKAIRWWGLTGLARTWDTWSCCPSRLVMTTSIHHRHRVISRQQLKVLQCTHSGHLVPSPILGLANAPIVTTKLLELAMSLLDFSPRIPLGTFSILL